MNNNERFILTTGTIGTMETFAENVRYAMENYFDKDHKIMVHKVTKNNNLVLTGLTILDKNTNIAPTIYLENFFMQYSEGKGMVDICKEIISIYQANKIMGGFDVEIVTDFMKIQHRICYKVVSADRNKELLKEMPHIIFHDLAIVFYIAVPEEMGENATITVKDQLMNLWGVDKKRLLELAIENTQRLFRGRVTSIINVLTDVIAEKLDEESAMEFYDMAFSSEEIAPMYVASNHKNINGAGVIFYPGLLKEFADRVNSDFYIIPSSIHETLLIPTIAGMEPEFIRELIIQVNCNEVAEEEVLSDNLYFYNRALDRVEMV